MINKFKIFNYFFRVTKSYSFGENLKAKKILPKISVNKTKINSIDTTLEILFFNIFRK